MTTEAQIVYRITDLKSLLEFTKKHLQIHFNRCFLQNDWRYMLTTQPSDSCHSRGGRTTKIVSHRFMQFSEGTFCSRNLKLQTTKAEIFRFFSFNSVNAFMRGEWNQYAKMWIPGQSIPQIPSIKFIQGQRVERSIAHIESCSNRSWQIGSSFSCSSHQSLL